MCVVGGNTVMCGGWKYSYVWWVEIQLCVVGGNTVMCGASDAAMW